MFTILSRRPNLDSNKYILTYTPSHNGKIVDSSGTPEKKQDLRIEF